MSHMETQIPPQPLRLNAQANRVARSVAIMTHRIQDEAIAVVIAIVWVILGMRDFCLKQRREWD